MPTATFELPDELQKKTGKKEVLFEMPEGATEADAYATYDNWILEQSIVKAPQRQQSFEMPKPTMLEAFGGGLQKAGTDLYAGIMQTPEAVKRITGEMPVTESPIARQQAQREMEYEKVRSQRPFSFMAGEYSPYIPFASGTVPFAAEVMKYGEPGERLTSGVVAGLSAPLGRYIGETAGAYISPNVDRATMQAIRQGEGVGLTPRLSERLGSKELGRLEDVVASSPGGGSMAKIAEKNQIAANRAASKSIGENAPYLTDDVWARASARISQPFNELEAASPNVLQIRYGKSVKDSADSIIRQQKFLEKSAPGTQDQQLLNIAETLKNAAISRNPISGAEYKILRERLSDLAWDATGSVKNNYADLLKAVDNSADNSLIVGGFEKLAKDLRTARSQYANLKTLEKGQVVRGGNVDINKLSGALKQRNARGYLSGKGDENLYPLAKFAESTQRLKEGSQTAPRTFYQELLENPVTGLPMAAVNKMVSGVLTSPITSFIPKTFGQSVPAKIGGKLIEPAVRVPTIGVLTDYITRGTFPKNYKEQQ
jgi:hypothetical protein